jgi:ATP-dependent helicase/nuclease subunit B
MLSIVTGPFHPDLEAALVAQVRSLKQGDPLAPVAIVVPSHQLARRVKWLLAVEQGLALLETDVLAFHELAEAVIRDTGVPLPTFVDDAFREQLLRYLVDRGVPGAEAFQRQRGMRGLWAELWATIQDLKEAQVEPATALAALEEGRLRSDDPVRLAALLRLHGAVLEVDRTLRLADADDLATLAAEHVRQSVFLQRMRRICYYGFYDLTQGQLDFFKAVAGSYPTTVFFPLPHEGPAYRFAQRFFAAHVQGLTGESQVAGELPRELVQEIRASCRIVSAVGIEDEVSSAAKEILHLIEDQGYDPLEIGVVARAFDPYLPTLRRVFDANRIPFACPMGEPIVHEPLVKMLVRFLRLPVESFPRAGVIEILTAPLCRLSSLCPLGNSPRPEQWDWATRRLGIVRADPENGSLGDWKRLEQAARKGLAAAGDDEAEPARMVLVPAQLQLLFDLVVRLHRDLSELPERAGWKVYTEALLRLIPTYFDLPAWAMESPSSHMELLQATIRRCLSQVATLDQLSEEVPLADWTKHVVRVLEHARLPSETRDQVGVQVLDAMAARGVPFRALFVLGLNEKVFPRSIREDAFLRDVDREVLANDLGYKISCKLEGFDEERLLFALLLRSVRDQLVLSYQRADCDGRVMVPSGYLAELKPLLGKTECRIKRRPTERWSERPFAWSLLTPQEAGLTVVLQGSASSDLLPLVQLYQSPELFAQGSTAATSIDSMKPALTPYDGLVGPALAHWHALERQGVSPTALERYALCPFKYFAEKVLRLEPLETPESVAALDARACGQLCHDVLREFYERRSKSGLPPAAVGAAEFEAWLAEATTGVFARFEEAEPVGYPLLWSLIKEHITWLLRTFIEDDLKELRESGYSPALFEVEVAGQFGSALPDTLGDLPIHGRLDRVDIKRVNEQAHIRVVDYKYTESKESKTEDRDLATAAVRGKRLQPPLYLLAAKAVLGKEPAVPDAAAFYFLAPYWPNGPVVRTALTEVCGMDTVRVVLDGVRGGRFFILPGDYCTYCEFSSTCRRTHHPTKWRLRDNAEKQVLEDIRRRKAGKA